jgi:synaptic vesicle membrane protein VAT-1
MPIRKAVISALGSVSNLSVVQTTIPSPSPTHVQVQVLYASFSGADAIMLKGWYPLQKSAPLTTGYALVGRVVTNGSRATKYPAGTLVAALTDGYGAQAERINLAERHLIPVPVKLDNDSGHQQVAALVMDWTTALGMVDGSAKVRAGQRVFIHGMSGAVGYALLALCLRRGAVVYGTASARNHAALKKLGAEEVYAYDNKHWMEAVQKVGGMHAVFDPLGFESFDESFSVLAKDGVLVGYGGNKGALAGGEHRSPYPYLAKLLAQNLKPWSQKSTTFFYINRDDKSFAPNLMKLMEMIAAGKVEVLIKGIWDLETESLRALHESWGKLSGMGSLLVRVAQPIST